MLTHFVVGPTASSRYLVAYLTPGCSVLTLVADCPTAATADEESVRLNRNQLEREKTIRRDHELRGFKGVYPDLAIKAETE